MAFIRVKKIGSRYYFYLVKSVRTGNKVRQKVVKYLGTSKKLASMVDHAKKK